MVAGIIALCLEARPELTWRDVQAVIIESAAMTSPNDPDWKQNGAGHLVNHKFGFGRMDGARAVEAAIAHQLLPEAQSIDSLSLRGAPIPDGGRVELTWVCEEELIVEHVDVFFDAQHPHRGELQIVLTSPFGTESILAESHHDLNSNYNLWRFMTIRNWGESSLGTWTLRVADMQYSGVSGRVAQWSLIIHSHAHSNVTEESVSIPSSGIEAQTSGAESLSASLSHVAISSAQPETSEVESVSKDSSVHPAISSAQPETSPVEPVSITVPSLSIISSLFGY